MNAPLKFAIVGFGNIGQRHAKHIQSNQDTQLVAVCDISSIRRQEIPDGIAKFETLESMLTIDFDVLCVCTPNFLHEPHTIASLNAGRHVVVEKPMALSVQECENMIAAADASKKKIFAVKQNRYNPPVAEVKQLIENNGLGKIFLVQVNCFWNRGDSYYAESDWRGKKQKDGGCLFTQFSHFIDILYYLNGPIRSSQGLIQNFGHQHNTELEDTGSFVMNAENDSIVNFNFTTCSYNKNMEGSITLIGEKGTVKIGGQYLNTIEYQQLAGEKLPDINITAKANNYGLYQGSMSNHDKVIENVVDVLLKNGKIMTTAIEGMEVVKTIETMYNHATMCSI